MGIRDWKLGLDDGEESDGEAFGRDVFSAIGGV